MHRVNVGWSELLPQTDMPMLAVVVNKSQSPRSSRRLTEFGYILVYNNKVK